MVDYSKWKNIEVRINIKSKIRSKMSGCILGY